MAASNHSGKQRNGKIEPVSDGFNHIEFQGNASSHVSRGESNSAVNSDFSGLGNGSDGLADARNTSRKKSGLHGHLKELDQSPTKYVLPTNPIAFQRHSLHLGSMEGGPSGTSRNTKQTTSSSGRLRRKKSIATVEF